MLCKNDLGAHQDALDEKLRKEIEQSFEWQSSLYINFIDFKKDFDNLGSGLPVKTVTTIRAPYEGQWTVPLGMRTGTDKAACYPSCCF